MQKEKKDETSSETKRSWRETFFVAFESEEVMLAYYQERKFFMQLMYLTIILKKMGSIVQIFSLHTYREE